jgi:heat shock protein HslJ
VVGSLAACGSSSPEPQATTGLPLESTPWGLTSYTDDTGSQVDVPEPVVVTAVFEQGTVSGTGGCNRYTASYETDGSALTIGAAASTLIACAEPQASVEAAFLLALADTASYATDTSTLTLLDDSGDALLVFEVVQPASLTGTTWSATGVNNGQQAVTGLVTGTTVTATFADDGTVSGSAGCNRFTGEYTLDGDAVAIGPLATTRKACEDDVMTQEAAFVAAMENATTVAIDGSTMELRDDEGALQVSFSAEG